MTEIVQPVPLSGEYSAPPSKSHAHRLLICAALSEKPVIIENFAPSDDLDATMSALRAMGASFSLSGTALRVTPMQTAPGELSLDVGESGSTLRFLLPVLGALGISAALTLHGRLPLRPIAPLVDALNGNGMTVSQSGDTITCKGRLRSGSFALPGDVSSQFISGLLFALPLLDGDSTICLTSPLQSAQYAAMTLDVLTQSGIEVDITNGTYHVPGKQTYRLPQSRVECDWSSAANFLVAGAFSPDGVCVKGLFEHSLQPDRTIIDVLRKFGVNVAGGSEITVCKGALQGTVIDASQSPDLVPIVAVLGAAAAGETQILNAARLRLKESDRLASVSAMLSSLGGRAVQMPDGLRIIGSGTLCGGNVPTCGDHRVVMAAAIAAAICRKPVVICDAECVKKSYPDFFRDLKMLKGAAL